MSGAERSVATTQHHCRGADPGLTDVLRFSLGPQRPGDIAPVADLLIRYQRRDRALPLALAGTLAMGRLRLAFTDSRKSTFYS